MKIGILGTDPRALAIGRLLASGGHDVEHSGDERPYELALRSDLLILAVPPALIDKTIADLGAPVDAVVVDAVEYQRAEPAGSGVQMLAHKLDTHTVVRALIVLPQPGANILICGDDPQAKRLVDEAFAACGCLTTDRGPLANSDELEPAGAATAV